MSLCLACASSLPTKSLDVFYTQCCKSPICPACITANPRLTRYNPCLACGVDLKSSHNIDGGIRDEETYVIDDDDDDGEPLSQLSTPVQETAVWGEPEPEAQQPRPPATYYLKTNDTLQGIALRFGLNGRELCLLNKLPPSTLTTTPHLLHTRTSLVMPSSVAHKLPDESQQQVEVRRARERAAKRLQTLTKEVDWSIAQTYIALADDQNEHDLAAWKRKEDGRLGQLSLDALALDKYLDDDEWERRERSAGRGVKIHPFPFIQPAVAPSLTSKLWSR